jgi:hypothetical protein
MKIGTGSLIINDGVYVNQKDNYLDRYAKGIVRKDFTYEPLVKNKLVKNNQKSFEVGVKCTYRMSIIKNEISYNTNLVFSNEKNYTRVSNNNYLKDIKEFICPIAGPSESSKVRKRLIALERIHKSISNQKINFAITDEQ